MDIIVTGAAGFIGFHLSKRLIADGHTVIGIDNVNDYYDVKLKEARLSQLQDADSFTFYRQDIAEREGLDRIFADHAADRVIHLAAQAGVRYSIDHPHAYVQSNLVGFANILECCRRHESPHLVFASSSSVYGNNQKVPFSETDSVDNPISLYAA
ncbi:MAG: GDP-mannose 4,6-dehydratase, partial [Gammaproteobacteria bacterium]|nr:GDP-mannose 4,6-dehydratase [Gammaproteobacteria bacterium]